MLGYLSGPAGCIWPAARPGALGAHHPPSALPSAVSGAPPHPAAPQGLRGPREAPAAPGRPPPVPPPTRTGTRRCSWLRRAKGATVNEKVKQLYALRRVGAPRVSRRGLSPNPRCSRPARLVQAPGFAKRRPEPSGHRTRVRAHPACLLGE